MRRRLVMRVIIGLLIVIMVEPVLMAWDTEQDRLADSAKVLEEILNIPDALPKGLLNKAECVAVMPSVKKFAIGIGGSYGRGVLGCRTGDRLTGPWGGAAAHPLGAGSPGLERAGSRTPF